MLRNSIRIPLIRINNYVNMSLIRTNKSSSLHTSALKLNTETKNIGRQNTFYFEPSHLLPNDKINKNYAKLYKEIPVVFVIGWTGSHDKSLSKFSDIYNKLGYHTIRFSPSISMVFLQHKKHKFYTEQLINLMKQTYGLEKNKIFIHSFSNSGFFVFYQHIIDIHNKKYKDLLDSQVSLDTIDFIGRNQVGVLFDSGVGWLVSFSKLIPGIQNIIGKNILSYLLAIIMASMYNIYKTTISNDYFHKGIENFIHNDDRNLPTLMIYSKNDNIMDHDEITKIVNKRKDCFPDMYVKSEIFEDPEHVMIYKKHPEKYIEIIKKHLQVCNIDLTKIGLK